MGRSRGYWRWVTAMYLRLSALRPEPGKTQLDEEGSCSLVQQPEVEDESNWPSLLQSKVFFSLENKKSLWRLESWRMQTVWVWEIFTKEEWKGCEFDKRGRQFSATWPRSSVSRRFSLTKHERGEQLAQQRTMFFIPRRSSSMHWILWEPG